MKPKRTMTRAEEWKAVVQLLEWHGWITGYTFFEASREAWRIKEKYPFGDMLGITAYATGAAYSRRMNLKEHGKRLPRFRSIIAAAVWRGRRSAREYWNSKHPNGPMKSEQSCLQYAHGGVA